MARAPKETSETSAAKPDKLAEARGRNLDLAIQQIQKDYGEGAILRIAVDHARRTADHHDLARR